MVSTPYKERVVSGTPAFFVNGVPVPGFAGDYVYWNVSQWQALIDPLLAARARDL
jgi:hypothetical protein